MLNNIARIQRALTQAHLDAILLTDENDRRFATGFPSSDGTVIVTVHQAFFITDSRYIEAARAALAGIAQVLLCSHEAPMRTLVQGILREANVQLLVNCSGYGKFQAACDTPLSQNLNMVDLNCEALMAMCQLTIPYMHAGAQIINIASVAACQPVPYIGVYAASKAFVLSYSRALNRELDDKDISVMAVCPFWTKTEFFDHAVIDGEKPVVKKYAAMYEPQQIVARAWRDAKRGKDVSKFGFIARAQMALVKILPHGLIMDIWLSQQKL